MDLSVIVTAYNYASYIEETIDTILQQNEHGLQFEILIINDGSTDNTIQTLEKYKQVANLVIVNIENSGIEKASNIGFLKSEGRYVVRLDADDKLKPDFMRVIESELLHGYDVLYGDYSLIDENSQLIRDVKLPLFNETELKQRGDFLASGTVYRSSILSEIGYYPEKVKNSGLENFELLLILLEKQAKFKKVDSCIFEYRLHSGSVSSTKRESIIEFGQHLAKQYSLEAYMTNKNHPYGLKI